MKVRYTFTVIREFESSDPTMDEVRDRAESVADEAGEHLYDGSWLNETIRFKAEYKHAFLGWKRLVCLLPLLLLLGCQTPTVAKVPQSRAVSVHVASGNVTLIWFWSPLPQIMGALDPQNFKPVQYTNPPYRPATWLEGSDGGPWHQISPNLPYALSNFYILPATNAGEMIRSAYGWKRLVL